MRIKDAVFSAFGEVNLPSINTKAPPSEIIKWKNQSSVNECYRILFQPMNSTEDTTYMTCILQKLWPKTDLKQVPDIWIAYAASTSEILLNPSIPTIQISEAKMKPRLKKYLKVVEKIIDDEIFSSDIESSGSEKRNKEHRNEKEEREIEAGEGGGEDDDQNEDVFFLVENDAKLKKRKHHKK